MTLNRTSWVTLVLLALTLVLGACDRNGKKPIPPKVNTDKAEWTPEEIAADTAGYLRWSQGRIGRQIAEYDAKIKLLENKRAQFVEKTKILTENTATIRYTLTEAEKAYRRADDDDRWPATLSGRQFDRAKLEAVIKGLKLKLEDSRPMQESYTQFMDRIDGTLVTYKEQRRKAEQLREQVKLDLESMELNQSTGDASKAQKSNEQLASLSASLRDMSDEASKMEVPREPTEKVRMEDLLK